MIKNYNRGEVKKGEFFHFEHSLRPFVLIEGEAEDLFLDLDNWKIFDADSLYRVECLYFYENEEDEDFYGVDVVCSVEEWFSKGEEK